MTPVEQIQAQERTILSLRAQLAESKTREANLRRMHEHDQRMIGKLQAQVRSSKVSEADKVFGGQS